jgi:hypothetical protein
MYAATTKDEGNAADVRFSTACEDVTLKTRFQTSNSGLTSASTLLTIPVKESLLLSVKTVADCSKEVS